MKFIVTKGGCRTHPCTKPVSQNETQIPCDFLSFAENDPQILMESFFAFRRAKAGVLKNIIKNSYIGCCMAFRRELLSTILPIPEGIEMHDQWIGILGDYHAGKSCFLSEPLLLYRRHEDNNSAMSHYGMVRMIRNRMVFVFQSESGDHFLRQQRPLHHGSRLRPCWFQTP